jgi:hypothetical protein
MLVDDVWAQLLLAVLYQVPVFLAAMACTWLAHEWALHRGARLTLRSVLSRAFWTKTVWDHPTYFTISYVILFIAFLSLFQLPGLLLANARGQTLPSAFLGLVPALAYVMGFLALGYFALRARLRGHMA